MSPQRCHHLPHLILSLPLALALACVDEPDPAQTDSSVDTSESESGEGESGEGPLPDVGPAPDDHCPNPGPWPLPEPPEYEVPQFIDTSFVELDKIGWVSKFRSTIGHDYSDDYEHCRSMKHYLYPFDEVDWAAVEIRSPFAGEVIRVEQEMFGSRVQIRSATHPELDFMIWHVALDGPLAEGAVLAEGEVLGTHSGFDTYVDMALIMNMGEDKRLISWFEAMTDTLLAEFQARGGIQTRADVIIDQAARDADPLCCTDGQFDGDELLEDWVELDAGNPFPPARLGLAGR